jgi:hypothetical protein
MIYELDSLAYAFHIFFSFSHLNVQLEVSLEEEVLFPTYFFFKRKRKRKRKEQKHYDKFD